MEVRAWVRLAKVLDTVKSRPFVGSGLLAHATQPLRGSPGPANLTGERPLSQVNDSAAVSACRLSSPRSKKPCPIAAKAKARGKSHCPLEDALWEGRRQARAAALPGGHAGPKETCARSCRAIARRYSKATLTCRSAPLSGQIRALAQQGAGVVVGARRFRRRRRWLGTTKRTLPRLSHQGSTRRRATRSRARCCCAGSILRPTAAALEEAAHLAAAASSTCR